MKTPNTSASHQSSAISNGTGRRQPVDEITSASALTKVCFVPRFKPGQLHASFKQNQPSLSIALLRFQEEVGDYASLLEDFALTVWFAYEETYANIPPVSGDGVLSASLIAGRYLNQLPGYVLWEHFQYQLMSMTLARIEFGLENEAWDPAVGPPMTHILLTLIIALDHAAARQYRR